MSVKKAFFIIVFLVMFLPVYFMFIGGLQDMNGILKMPPNLFPLNPYFGNYERIFTWTLLTWLKNTMTVTIITVCLTILIASSTGYAFAFYRMKRKELLWGMLLMSLMVPRISLLIPTFVIVKYLGLSGTMAAVILPTIYYPVGMYLARTYFSTISASLLESARLDGANEWQILWRIVMPISKPILTCLALFSSIGTLGDYIWQVLVLQREDSRTLLVGMIQSASVRSTAHSVDVNPFGISLAVGSLLLIPLLFIFLLSNRYFTQSLGGAVKE